jgi:hypothetical protein
LQIYYDNFSKIYPQMSKISFDYIMKHMVYDVTDRHPKPQALVAKDFKEEEVKEIWKIMLDNMKNLSIHLEKFSKDCYKYVYECYQMENSIFSTQNYWQWMIIHMSQLC